MSGNRRVTDFFKPFSHPRPTTAPDASNGPQGPTIPTRASTRLQAISSSAKQEAIASSDPTKSSNAHVASGDEHVEIAAGRFAPVSSPALAAAHHPATKGKDRIIRSSDDEDASSESSLDTLEQLLAPRPETMAPAAVLDLARDVSRREEPRITRAQMASTNNRQPTRSIVRPQYRNSIASLVGQTEKDAASEAEVAKAKIIIDQDSSLARTHAATASTAPKGGATDDSLLASVVAADREGSEVQKIMHAMQRTEALNRTKVWFFFKERTSEKASTPPPFPAKVLRNRGWQSLLKDRSSRQITFLSGLVAEMVLHDPLPDELIRWMFYELCHESRADLIVAYQTTLGSCSDQITRLLEPDAMDGLLACLQATPEAIDLMQEIHPMPEGRSNDDRRDWMALRSVIAVMGGVPHSLTSAAREHAICLLLRLTLDSNVVREADILHAIQLAIKSLSASLADEGLPLSLIRVSSVVFGYTTYGTLRLQMLNHIPISPGPLYALRRRLAMAYFFEDRSILDTPSGPLVQFPRIMTRLDDSRFDIGNETNYTELAALLSILDIGLDDGCSSCDLDVTIAAQERAFNGAVDELARKIKVMFTTISDSGAAHMTRTEAKEVLERVHYRLVYGVRTKSRPKQHLFQSTLAVNAAGADDDADDAASHPASGIVARLLASSRTGRSPPPNAWLARQ
ncbi:MAG: hypothetical protein M1838_005043 [Thelocarpon superellum]|nr:MAG: hypothetical protein M1838_005043 [Thelocarpon superellum]